MLPQIASWHVLGRSCHQDCFWHNTGCYIDCFCKSDQLVHMLSALDSLLGTSWCVAVSHDMHQTIVVRRLEQEGSAFSACVPGIQL